MRGSLRVPFLFTRCVVDKLINVKLQAARKRFISYSHLLTQIFQNIFVSEQWESLNENKCEHFFSTFYKSLPQNILDIISPFPQSRICNILLLYSLILPMNYSLSILNVGLVLPLPIKCLLR